jgi:hypothetical protein
MSETVGIRELKNGTSEIIDRVEAGEPITVTRRGKPGPDFLNGDAAAPGGDDR